MMKCLPALAVLLLAAQVLQLYRNAEAASLDIRTVNAVHGKPQPQSAKLLSSIKADVHAVMQDVWLFWARHGVDSTHGGFHGTLARDGGVIDPMDKGIVQQARHVW